MLTLAFRGHVEPRGAAPLSRRRPDSRRVHRLERRLRGYRRRRREHLPQMEGGSRCWPWQHWTSRSFPAVRENPMHHLNSVVEHYDHGEGIQNLTSARLNTVMTNEVYRKSLQTFLNSLSKPFKLLVETDCRRWLC